MKVYLVGGAVRDQLLGRVPKDRDYVVVGATPDQMLALGYKQVGADFPVFLDDAGTEFALARTERKTGSGYNGFTCDFDPSTTVEDDLRRRDLTINSMARDEETGELIDPFGGERDLKTGTLRHTSEAFAEDPVRVLRVARFASRYNSFAVAAETLKLMESLIPEMETLTTERVWMELEKAMMEVAPDRFLSILNRVGAWDRLFPEIRIDCEVLDCVTESAKQNASLQERIATLFACSFLNKANNCLDRYKAPAELSRLIHNVWKLRQAVNFNTESVPYVDVLNSIDGYRRPEGLHAACNVLRCLNDKVLYNAADNFEAVFYATVAVDFASLPFEIKNQRGPAISKAITEGRHNIVKDLKLLPLNSGE